MEAVSIRRGQKRPYFALENALASKFCWVVLVLFQWSAASHGLVTCLRDGRLLQASWHRTSEVSSGLGSCSLTRRDGQRQQWKNIRLRGGSPTLESDDRVRVTTEKVGSLTVSTFNMWCPLFRRIPTKEANGTTCETSSRESAFPELYMQRQEAIIRMLLRLDSDIVCLQEFWVANEDMVSMYRAKLDSRYQWQQLNRSGSRGDGIVTLLRHSIAIKDRRDILLHDMGDRVALLLRLHLPTNVTASPSDAEVLLVNTHLVFAHQPYFSIIRMRELRQILAFLELYRQTRHKTCPILLCGDLNGSPSGFQSRHLRGLNFTSSCADDTRWVTHKNHRGVTLCCDYVWMLNPSTRPPLLEQDWQAMVFYSTRQRLSAWIRRRLPAQRPDTDDDPWATVDVSFHREALSQLGYGAVVPVLTDQQLENLLAGPDRTYVDHDRLMGAADVFHLFDLDHSRTLDLREFTYLCADLDIRLDHSAAHVFQRLDRTMSGAVGLVEFTAWWHRVLPCAWGVGQGCGDHPPKGDTRAGQSQLHPSQVGSDEPHALVPGASRRSAEGPSVSGVKAAYELSLDESRVFPRRLQEGRWDDKFSLSDHGVVTCRYSILPPKDYCSAVEYRAAVDYLSGGNPSHTPVATEHTDTQAQDIAASSREASPVTPLPQCADELAAAWQGRGGVASGESEVAFAESESQLEGLDDARLHPPAVRVISQLSDGYNSQ